MPKRVRKKADNSGAAAIAAVDVAIACISEAFVKREKMKARLLRQTQWWKAKRSTGVCYYCNNNFAPAELTMDHIIPISRGGMSIKSNIAVACKGCNDRKKHTLPYILAGHMDNTVED
ncbi:MAG: HNH endonuclease [Nitrospirae bacterium]|nr:HNH endonuclease [Nitrospirota bacterium]